MRTQPASSTVPRKCQPSPRLHKDKSLVDTPHSEHIGFLKACPLLGQTSLFNHSEHTPSPYQQLWEQEKGIPCLTPKKPASPRYTSPQGVQIRLSAQDKSNEYALSAGHTAITMNSSLTHQCDQACAGLVARRTLFTTVLALGLSGLYNWGRRCRDRKQISPYVSIHR